MILAGLEVMMHDATRWASMIFLGLLLVATPGCSFIFDFTECEANEDCRQFDEPDQEEFFVCSTDNKCVLEPERQCRVDDHCAEGQTCNASEGTCTQSGS